MKKTQTQTITKSTKEVSEPTYQKEVDEEDEVYTPPLGTTLGDDPDEEAKQLKKQSDEDLKKEKEKAAKELEETIEKNMNKFGAAMEETLSEIMRGKPVKKEGTSK